LHEISFIKLEYETEPNWNLRYASFTDGEECVFDMDCQSDGSYCEVNICVSAAEGNKGVLPYIGEIKMLVYTTLATLILLKIRKYML
jgi:hypothetical protein